MAESSHAKTRTVPAGREHDLFEIEHQLSALARALVSVTSAAAALISCRVGGVETIVREPSCDSRRHSVTAKALAALDAAALNQPTPQDPREPARVMLTAEQLAPTATDARVSF